MWRSNEGNVFCYFFVAQEEQSIHANSQQSTFQHGRADDGRECSHHGHTLD